MSDNPSPPDNQQESPPRLSEDWLAVILAFAIVLLSAIGILGENGLKISF